jgi:hypothetical protein
MSDPIERPSLPPGAAPDPAAPVPQEVAEEARRSAAASVDAGAVLAGTLDVAEVAGGVVGVVADAVGEDAAAAVVEVGASVVGGAFEALGSGGELLGGCAEGCSFVLAFVLVLATAGALLAYGVS